MAIPGVRHSAAPTAGMTGGSQRDMKHWAEYAASAQGLPSASAAMGRATAHTLPTCWGAEGAGAGSAQGIISAPSLAGPF